MDEAHRLHRQRSQDTGTAVATAAIFLGAIAGSAALRWWDRGVYSFLFGGLDPLLVTGLAACLGAASLRGLVVLGWFSAGAASRKSVVLSFVLGAALTSPVILVDVFGGFPAEMNVGFPQSLFFYPSIALVAESTFHLVPLAVVAMAWRWGPLDGSRPRLLAIAVAAVIEPIFQVAWGGGESPAWANCYVGVHLLVFNVVGLEIFRRSGFIALYGFRVGYYVVWHVVWGHFRVALLFQGGG